MSDYDISKAFQRIEEYLISSMIRNMKHHLSLEETEDLNYTMWQAKQLEALQAYRMDNQKIFTSYFSTINDQIKTALKKAYKSGQMDQETEILEALKKGFRVPKGKSSGLYGEFFKINQRKLNALITATVHDMQKAETAMLRMANDQYRKIIFDAQVYANTGVGTLEQAVDMASKDFLARGLNCIEYSNGARVSIDSYARMAIDTANTRAYLQGESAKRDEWGISTVLVTRRNVACPKCLKWIAKVYYDDIYGNVPVPDNKYPKLSAAIAGGLYHPNCKDSHTTYFEGINTPPKPLTQAEIDEANRVYSLQQQQRFNERNIRKYKRLRDGSLDSDNKEYYSQKVKEWQGRNNDFVKKNEKVLRRDYKREDSHDVKVTPPPLARMGDIVKPTEHGILKLTSEEEKAIQTLDFKQMSDGVGRLSNRAARKWYKCHDEQIPNIIDRTKSIEEQARQACELRNQYRTQARELMREQEARKQLDIEYPNKSFEDLLNHKISDKGMTREEAVQDILNTSVKTNKKVNEKFGLE